MGANFTATIFTGAISGTLRQWSDRPGVAAAGNTGGTAIASRGGGWPTADGISIQRRSTLFPPTFRQRLSCSSLRRYRPACRPLSSGTSATIHRAITLTSQPVTGRGAKCPRRRHNNTGGHRADRRACEVGGVSAREIDEISGSFTRPRISSPVGSWHNSAAGRRQAPRPPRSMWCRSLGGSVSRPAPSVSAASAWVDLLASCCGSCSP
jgi:hypothetical protein